MIDSAGRRLELLVEVGLEAVALAVDDAVLEPLLDRPARAVLALDRRRPRRPRTAPCSSVSGS